MQLVRAAGKDPDKYLQKQVLAEPNRTIVAPTEEERARALLAALADYVEERIAAPDLEPPTFAQVEPVSPPAHHTRVDQGA